MVNIRTKVFEGPLSTLLDLVERRKLFISDISLAEVTDEYMERIRTTETFPVEEATQFLSVASTLILIKSRSLLPGFSITTEEQSNIDELKSRLELLAMYRKASILLMHSWNKSPLYQTFEKKRPAHFAPGKTLASESIFSAILSVIHSLPKFVEHTKVAVKKIRSLEETMSMITERITRHLKFSFSEFAKSSHQDGANHKEKKIGVILSFLAILELVKRGVVHVKQETALADFEVENATVDVPRYN